MNTDQKIWYRRQPNCVYAASGELSCQVKKIQNWEPAQQQPLTDSAMRLFYNACPSDQKIERPVYLNINDKPEQYNLYNSQCYLKDFNN
jgi:hypothetical protein